MEVEMEPRVKPLTYKIKAMSRETTAQKAINVIDTDLRNHWSTGTNTKEWILLELEEPCLLSHIRIHNKSVLEWEVAAGLRYKPETFVRVRARCEAPRRDMTYPMNYTPCRYVRVSCLRGNPIAIFFIQLIGISVPGLEPEFLPVVNYLVPQIVSHNQDSNGQHLQLLQDITDRLHAFLPQLEADLTKYADELETSTRFLAMLAGPFYPIIQIVSEREIVRGSTGARDLDVARSSQLSPALTVSSNFEPRRLRNMSPLCTSQSTAFRPDAIFMLLRKAFADDHLRAICKVASRIIHCLAETTYAKEQSSLCPGGTSPLLDEAPGAKSCNHVALSDYSELFGEEFCIPIIDWDPSYINVIDIGAVEEGILHVLYACASEPLLCSKLAGSVRNFWMALPLIQALLPALRPASSSVSVDDTFSQWMQPFVQQALSKIVLTVSSTEYHPLLHGCAGYLASYSPSHAKTASVLIDLCSCALAPWMPHVIAKIDLAMELLEDLLSVIQGERHSEVHVHAALIYLVLALSGYMDEVLTEYKNAKLRVLFLVEMLETFLVPVIFASQSMMGSGEVSCTFLDDHEHMCAIAIRVIHAAVKRPSILPSLELEWRLGSVPPRVLLSILDPHLQLPSDIDHCLSSSSKFDTDTSNSCSSPHAACRERSLTSANPNLEDKVADVQGKLDTLVDASVYFVPQEMRNLRIVHSSGKTSENGAKTSGADSKYEDKPVLDRDSGTQISKGFILDSGFSMNYFSLLVDHAQLLDYEDCKSRASEFRRLALDLHSQNNINHDGHNAALDALILSAECYINPFFMMSVKEHPKVSNLVNTYVTKSAHCPEILELRKVLGKGNCNLETISNLERKRDKVFIQILLEAAEMDRSYYQKVSDSEQCPYDVGADEELGNLSEYDASSADAITLVRRNQALLCNFVIHQLRRGQKSLHETLMQSLLFLLHAATKLVCSPEHVIDIILDSAEHLNKGLTSIFHQYKEGILHLSPEKVYRVQRHWTILQSLVIASSGVSSGPDSLFNVSGFRHNNLIPPTSWISKIPTFSSCAFPLVRYLGWMAISRNAKGFLNQSLFLTSNLSQLSQLLSIFADDLAALDCVSDSMKEDLNLEELKIKQNSKMGEKYSLQQYQYQSFSLMYSDLSIFFPDMPKEFIVFRENILEAVGLQLRSLAPTTIPDILCWFSDLCLSPFHEKSDKVHDGSQTVKGYHVRNAKAVILYVLEAIISEHMEAIVPEIPRLVQVLGSLCKSSYCDVSFLSSVMCLLKPIISYSLRKVSDEEKHLNGDPCLTFESLCFDEFFTFIRQELENTECPTRRVNIALTIFVLASVFHDLSFECKRKVIQSSLKLVDFPTLQPINTFYDYLCSFQQLLQNCNGFLVENLRLFGLIPMPQLNDVNLLSLGKNGSGTHAWFPDDFCYGHPTVEQEKLEGDNNISSALWSDIHHLSLEDIEGFFREIEDLIYKLNLSIELSWGLHPQLSRSLAVCSAQCLMYSKCLFSVTHKQSGVVAIESDSTVMCKSLDDFLTFWNVGIEGVVENITRVLEKNCWEVASTMVNCVLKLPAFCSLINVVGTLCSVVEKIMNSAPKIAWRLQTDKWLSSLLSRGIFIQENGLCLIELVSKMLSNPEPEQRCTALMHLGRIFGLNLNDEWMVLVSPSFDKLVSLDKVVSISESVLSHLVSKTWDQVAVVASADASLHLQTLAKALLVHFIPFAEHTKLKSFLETADTVFHGSLNFVYPADEGLLTQLSLALIAGICLYSPVEDMSLVPQSVSRYIETLGVAKAGRVGETTKRICQALSKVKNKENDAKEALKEALSTCPSKEFDPEFGNTRESVLQVLANLTSVQSYFDVFADKLDQKDAELEEAELEMDILQKEISEQGHDKKGNELSSASDVQNDHRLQQIKDGIRSLEKSKLREEIVARRQKKLLLRHTRQKYLEEATLREAELLQELDRQRTSEIEKEIERQRLLDFERSKTNELRYNLELEKEKQTQREIQRELEQVESGSRPSRREFSSSLQSSSRPRDRYRERENGRSTGEGSLRATSTSLLPDIPANTPSLATTPTVLSGSRTFSGQFPTILQSRDRVDECSSSYEENFDGSKDSGDTGSTGDPELGPGFDGLSGGLVSSQRHGSRGSKSRQVMERREREGRREGKWERKH